MSTFRLSPENPAAMFGSVFLLTRANDAPEEEPAIVVDWSLPSIPMMNAAMTPPAIRREKRTHNNEHLPFACGMDSKWSAATERVWFRGVWRFGERRSCGCNKSHVT